MAADAKTQIYYMNIAGTKWAWRCKKDTYKGIESELGIQKASDKDGGLVFGANRPKPVVIQINLVGGGSVKRFCHPDKVTGVCYQGKLNSKKVKNKNVNSVSTIGT